jgi:anti-sigma regulatory factor (Ser/Thr protein kinase)
VCRVVNTELDEDLSSVSRARRLVSDLLERWELRGLGEVAMLLTSELVANALIHTGGGASLVIAVADGVLEIGVSDHDHQAINLVQPKLERLGAADHGAIPAEGGRGLLIVDSLADEWGVVQLANGKQVWIRLSTDEWSYRSACLCHSDAIDRVRLDSGRYALAIPGPWDD